MSDSPDATAALARAARRVLAPLVRLLIARGVSYQVAAELLKQTYVAAGQQHFPGNAGTGSQLSLLTGLNRKEVKRLTTEAPALPDVAISFAAAVYQAWRLKRRWRVASGPQRGAPKRLPRHGDASFDELVRSITQDHRPAALLDELVRLGYVTLEDDDTVSLVGEAFLSRQTFSDRLAPLADNLEDHAAAAVANVLADSPQFLERSLFADELSAASARAFQDDAGREWQRMHDQLIERANTLEAADAQAREQSGLATNTRVRIGLYVYIDPPNNASQNAANQRPQPGHDTEER